uniref:Secreted protein n=1 Tax=Globodera rostochiensis TaxID=31243 RepID=A0A914HJR3_GLORO
MQFLSISILIISIAFAACFVCGAFGGCFVSKQTAEPMQKTTRRSNGISMESGIGINGQKPNRKTQNFRKLKSKQELPNESNDREIRDLSQGPNMRDVINTAKFVKARKSSSKK